MLASVVMACTIARAFQVDKNEYQAIYYAGLLHDIGKIGIPDTILSKPGLLTAEEKDKMKQHPAIGANIMKNRRLENR